MPSNFLILVLGGLLGAAEVAMTSHLLLQVFAPHLINDNDYGDVFLIIAPLGALLGCFIAPFISCLKWRQISLHLVLKAWVIASIIGVPASFGGGMFISMGPVWYIYGVYGIQLAILIVALVVIHRSVKRKVELTTT